MKPRPSLLGPKVFLTTALLLITTGCFDQSTRVPEAPVATSGVNSCTGQHGVFVPTGETEGSRADHKSQAEIGAGWGGACGPELYDPDKGTFSSADLSGAAHNEETAIVLTNGRVLLACAGTAAELYDPKSGQFNRTDDMLERMDLCSGMPLKDGRVLVMGATNLASTTPRSCHLASADFTTQSRRPFPGSTIRRSTLAIRYLHPSMTVGF